jgi:hypothetical protein
LKIGKINLRSSLSFPIIRPRLNSTKKQTGPIELKQKREFSNQSFVEIPIEKEDKIIVTKAL